MAGPTQAELDVWPQLLLRPPSELPQQVEDLPPQPVSHTAQLDGACDCHPVTMVAADVGVPLGARSLAA